MNVGDKKSVQKAFEYLENAQEKIDICINSAGVAKRTPIFEEEETDHFENILHTNVAGLWYVTKVAANHMKHHGIQGSIINMGSVNGANRVGEEFAAYCASKAAVAQMTKALVGELSRHQIRINCIAPGLFHTPLTDYRLNMKEEREEMEKFIPAGFVATPPDLDGAILYLSSNTASRYVTGVCLTVDGGISWGG